MVFSGYKYEFNSIETNGDIQVYLEIDGTVPDADKREEAVRKKRIDSIVDKFSKAFSK